MGEAAPARRWRPGCPPLARRSRWGTDVGPATEVCDRRDGGSAPVEVNITLRSSVEAVVATTTAALGPIDVLVNNAGIDVIEPFLGSEEEATWRRIVEVNYRAPPKLELGGRRVGQLIAVRSRSRGVHPHGRARRAGTSSRDLGRRVPDGRPER
jgi:2-hydroxycyclohexanecarboxyl-CoA dehydrogenase